MSIYMWSGVPSSFGFGEDLQIDFKHMRTVAKANMHFFFIYDEPTVFVSNHLQESFKGI